MLAAPDFSSERFAVFTKLLLTSSLLLSIASTPLAAQNTSPPRSERDEAPAVQPKIKPSANAVTQFGDVDNSLRWYQATGLQRPRFPMTLFLSSAGREAEGSFLTRDRFAGGQST